MRDESTMSHWSIAVKTVGQNDIPSHDFIIRVQPDDALSCMYDQIEEFTGLKASQQRLIYRGRIIRSGENHCDSIKHEPKVKDVVGLTDGQTIHLVPRPEPVVESQVDSTERNHGSQADSSDPSMFVSGQTRSADNDSASQTGTASLLAALLGIEVVDDDSTPDDNISLGQHLARLRSARVRHRNRRTSHRLTRSDLEIEDPGSMEPVRQGLMTVHTLLESNHRNGCRKFYTGQWIDCRDTVDQWLEATIVQIARPEEILPAHLLLGARANTSGRSYPTNDPPVTANDLDGRIRLLVEPTGDPPVDCEWGGYRQRSNNQGVALLLIHYNGWPHRWDEWIRSDSERIRPFRTRTRHPNSSTTACPTPESHFSASPTTHIRSADDNVDRAALLPELRRVFSVVHQQMESIAHQEISFEPDTQMNSSVPWLSSGYNGMVGQRVPDLVDDIDEPFLEDERKHVIRCDNAVVDQDLSDVSADKTKPSLKKQLQTLIPLLDRLGRALVDSAPQLAVYAATLPNEPLPGPERTVPGESNVVVIDEGEEEEVHSLRSLGSLFSSIPVDSRSAPDPAVASSEIVENDEYETLLEPDYADFRSAAVNTTRGYARTRNGGRSTSDEAGLLGAYLAAASLSSLANDEDGEGNSMGGLAGLGRLLRQRDPAGGMGGGIDIHIHAIVTGPATGGPAGIALLGETQIATPRPTPFSSNNRRAGITEPRIPPAAPINEDELGIFSDLYSANPTPVDLQNGVFPSGTTRASSVAAVADPLDENMTNEESTGSSRPFGSGGQTLLIRRSRRAVTGNTATLTTRSRAGRISRLLGRLTSRRSNSERSFQDLS